MSFETVNRIKIVEERAQVNTETFCCTYWQLCQAYAETGNYLLQLNN